MACIYCGKDFNRIWSKFQALKDESQNPIGLNVRVDVYNCPNDHVFAFARPAFRVVRKRGHGIQVEEIIEPKLTLDELRARHGLPPMTDENIRKNFITTHGKYKSK